ncbi:MAG TPA: hypothetical protein VFL96_00950 [Acidobacteriaceae bacterium]|nr:hypothetical protein [Acidobacteriaceae bacterium]
MRILALALIAYTGVMLVIHFSSWKLLQKWAGAEDLWASRWFSAQVALRVEAVYWLLVLAMWPLWPSAGWKALVVVFAVIHLGAWAAGELRNVREGGLPALPTKARRFVVGFDLVEAVALAAIAWIAVVQALRVA